MFPYEVGLALGCIAALVLTILIYVKVMPRKLDGTFEKPAFQKLHDFFHFKKLYLEEVLKFFYVLATVATVCVGAFMILSYYESYSWSYYGGGRTTKESLFFYGILTIITGPIALRLAYEVFMMFILLVKNTIEINNKLVAPSTPAPQVEAAPAEKVVPANVCPKCGNTHKEGAAFCPFCGQQL